MITISLSAALLGYIVGKVASSFFPEIHSSGV